MSGLSVEFEAAITRLKSLGQRPDNATLLKLYGLYKQATAGDVQGKRPGAFDLVGKFKYDAWAAIAGMPAEEAMQDYVDLVGSLQ